MEDCRKYLSIDLLVKILILLPVKSLVRLRCVCKLWFQVINSDSFKNAHLNASKKYILCEHSNFYSLHSEQSSIYKSSKIIRHHYMPESLDIDTRSYWRLEIYGNCNGVLCLSDYKLQFDSLVCLWNPMIRKAKKIPMTRNCASTVRACLCFGYYDGDYKVIKLGYIDKMICCLAVYSLRTDNWKIIDTSEFSDVTHLESYNSPPTAWLVNGAGYFGFHGRIVCFNLLEERIREIKYPKNFKSCLRNGVEAYGDSLIAFTEIGSGCLSMWVLKNCSKLSCSWWEKKLTIDLPNASYLIGFIDNDECLFRTRGDFYSYNLEIPQLNCIRFRLKLRNLSWVYTYTESLVLLDEKTIGPYAEPEPLSSYPLFTLHKIKARKKKRKIDEMMMQED